MKKLLYPLVIITVITLAFGYFGFYASNLVHALLVIAIISVLSAFIFPRNQEKQIKPYEIVECIEKVTCVINCAIKRKTGVS
jgi:hypothetical protein